MAIAIFSNICVGTVLKLIPPLCFQDKKDYWRLIYTSVNMLYLFLYNVTNVVVL